MAFPRPPRDHGGGGGGVESQESETTRLSVDYRPEASESAIRGRRWHTPRANTARLGATYFCFFLLGSNDSSYGVFIPRLESYYHVNYLTVSLVFLSPVVGFIISTLLNNSVHVWLGQRGVVLIAGACHVLAYLAASFHPPFGALIAVSARVGGAGGIKTAAWNSFESSFESSNELLGGLHGFYGLGATLTPIVASVLLTQHGWVWHQYYYVLLGMAVLDLIFSVSSFWTQGGKEYRRRTDAASQANHVMSLEPGYRPRRPGITRSVNMPSIGRWRVKMPTAAAVFYAPCVQPLATRVKRILRRFKGRNITMDCLLDPVCLLSSVFLLAYVGSEVTLGGWLVTFMERVRHGSPFSAAAVASGLWGGITAGRFVLGFATARLFPTEKHAVAAYLASAIVMESLFWAVPSFVSSAVFVALLGFFLGPLFPGVVACISLCMPEKMRVPAIGVVSAVGASGASVVPFVTGALAEARGVAVLQPIIFACLVLCLILWSLFPSLCDTDETDE